MNLECFSNPKFKRKMELLSYTHLPLILLILNEKGELIFNKLLDYIVYDLRLRISPASIRKTLLVAERLGLISRDADSKVYWLTDLGKKEAKWIKKLVEFLSKI